MWQRYKSFVIGFIGALIGTLLVLGTVHTYQDHRNLHAIIQFIQQAQQQAAGQQRPAAPPAVPPPSASTAPTP